MTGSTKANSFVFASVILPQSQKVLSKESVPAFAIEGHP